jgi:hypothetical protein
VGKQKRSQSTGKPPVSSHPLFPAIVALWFGALFGFGSLAIRKSLLETVMLKAQLDTVFESAAPPLGMTARIVLALIMAVMGAIAGGFLARMLARPKAKQAPRRRKASVSRAATAQDSEERNPMTFGRNSARAELQEPEEPAAPTRRRPLTVSSHDAVDDDDFHYRSNSAPLPGGPPEIFDVNASDLAAWKQPGTPIEVDDGSSLALDLSNFAAPASGEVNRPSLDSAQPAEFALPGDAFAIGDPFGDIADVPPADLSMFDPLPEQAPSATAMPGIPEAYDPIAEPNRFDPPKFQSFSVKPPAAAPTIPMAYEPEAVEAARDVVPANGLATEEISFAHRDETIAVAADAGDAADTTEQYEPAPAAPAIPEPYFAQYADQIAQPPSSPLTSVTAPPIHFGAPVQCDDQPDDLVSGGALAGMETMEFNAEPDLTAASVAAADLDNLSPTELLERLAVSIRNRKMAAASAAMAAAPSVAPEAAPAAVPAPVQPQSTPPQRLAIPAALKPINFNEYEDEDDHDAFLPQRRMVMVKPEQLKPQAVAQPFAPVAAKPVFEIDPAFELQPAAEPDVAEEEYSSLLDMTKPGQPRQSFVRVDEPEADDNDIETVVVFPGQGSLNGSRFAASAAPGNPAPQAFAAPIEQAAVQAAPAVRSFAEPPEFAEQSGSQPQQSTFPAGPAPIDPAETERALRSALASLQRMTGVA